MALAEAWLAEADDAIAREQDVRSELVRLADERLEALAAVETAEQRAERDGPAPEELRAARLNAARSAAEAAETRRRAHAEGETIVASVTAELAAASETERLAADAAADAEAAVTEAAERADRITAELRQIDEELAALDRSTEEANEHLQSLTEHETTSPEELARNLADAEEAAAAAEARAEAAEASLQELVVQRQEAAALVESLQDAPEPLDDASIAEEIEWYLLARLAAQRAVSLGGSLPLLLDDALVGLDEEQLRHVLGRLERMADAVQVIVVSDDPLAASWALMAGQERAAVVRPQPV
jgi:DNA repair exonuclease SbcCD ATPase subunit